jgi:sugar-specific transcriptional regulator TrmB
MGLDIYFKKRKKFTDSKAYDSIVYFQEKWNSAFYDLSDDIYNLIQNTFVISVKREIVKDALTPIFTKIKKEVDDILSNTSDTNLIKAVDVKIPNSNQLIDENGYYIGDENTFTINNEEKEIAYFRKVNFLLPFFNYQQNCSDVIIEKCLVENLVNLCNDVLKLYHKHKSGEIDKFELRKFVSEYLPTTSGFFFGSTEYDELNYFKNVETVRDKFSNILDTFDWENETFFMRCSW